MQDLYKFSSSKNYKVDTCSSFLFKNHEFNFLKIYIPLGIRHTFFLLLEKFGQKSKFQFHNLLLI